MKTSSSAGFLPDHFDRDTFFYITFFNEVVVDECHGKKGCLLRLLFWCKPSVSPGSKNRLKTVDKS
jgi:hypothetical protein